MRLALISIVYKGNRLDKIRVIDKESYIVYNLMTKDLIIAINKYGIEGLKEHLGEVTGTNGNIKRYKCECNRPVIIYKTNGGFILSDQNGNIQEMNTDKAIEYVLLHGVANGKLVDKDGIKYISAIAGSYEFKNTKKEVEINNDITRDARVNIGNTNEGKERQGVDSIRASSNGCSSTGKEGKEGTKGGRYRVSKIHGRLKEIGYKNNVGPKEFYDSILKAKKDNPYGACVDLHSTEDYGSMKCITFEGGKGGVAVHNGDIVSVFKHPDSSIKGFVQEALTAGIMNGGNKLDCYSINGGLPNLYTKCGFIPVCRIRFNKEFAPDDWDYGRYGEPDIVFMAYCGDTIDKMRNKAGAYKSYSDYADSDIPYISDKKHKSAYEIAYETRDNYIKNMNKQNTKGNWLSEFKGIKGVINTITKGNKQ